MTLEQKRAKRRAKRKAQLASYGNSCWAQREAKRRKLERKRR